MPSSRTDPCPADRRHFDRRRIGACGLAAALVFATFGAALDAAAQTVRALVDGPIPIPSNATLTRNFGLVAYGNEYSAGGERLRKWRAPLRLGLVSKTYPDFLEQDILQHIADLRVLTKHPIELYFSETMRREKRLAADFDRRKINVYLLYDSLENLARSEVLKAFFNNDQSKIDFILKNSTCFAHIRKKNEEIRAAVIGFPSERSPRMLRACVVEELTQILGLVNDNNTIEPSIFNDMSPYFELTGHDRMLVRVLYDQRLHVGMEKAEALGIVRQILDEIRPGH